jgi:heptosyltransferase-1
MIAPEPKRVLIIRLSAIGDVVFASPLVAACKKRYPEAEIEWLAEGVVRPLLNELPGLNKVILWPRQEWQDLWREKRLFALLSAVMAFRRKLRARNYDLVIDAQGLVNRQSPTYRFQVKGTQWHVSYRSFRKEHHATN